jgi:hypothetical protein
VYQKSWNYEEDKNVSCSSSEREMRSKCDLYPSWKVWVRGSEKWEREGARIEAESSAAVSDTVFQGPFESFGHVIRQLTTTSNCIQRLTDLMFELNWSRRDLRPLLGWAIGWGLLACGLAELLRPDDEPNPPPLKVTNTQEHRSVKGLAIRTASPPC